MTPFGDMAYTSIDTGEGPTGGIGAAPEGYPGHATFYVLVDDPAKTLEQIEAIGDRTGAHPWSSLQDTAFRSSGPDDEQRPAMLTVSVEEYDVAGVRPLFGQGTA